MAKWLVGPVLLIALTVGACSRTTVEAPVAGADEGGLEVTGIGRVEVRPDTLVVNMGVSSEAESATGALDAVSEGARAMLAAITENGVPQREIQTTTLNVQPQFDEQGNITGFTATEMFRVSIQDLEKAGAVVAAAVTAAGDDARVEGMSLEVADPETAKQAARKLAIEDAVRRGEELAET
ncbi:MAG: SIMPL domain-containing protein, partial [Actinomycetota bacterium]